MPIRLKALSQLAVAPVGSTAFLQTLRAICTHIQASVVWQQRLARSKVSPRVLRVRLLLGVLQLGFVRWRLRAHRLRQNHRLHQDLLLSLVQQLRQVALARLQ